MPALPLPTLAPADFTPDATVRWCPGCGDFAILGQMKKALAGLGLPREQFALVSGLGCAGRLPHYMNTYGFHTIAGLAPAIAAGLKACRSDLSVWVILGDGDGLGAGLAHLAHALRRNVGVKVVFVNNEVLGLSRGQTSPASRPGTRTQTDRDGSWDTPLRPASVALAAEASFVARTTDADADHMAHVLHRAALHPGAAFVEILQNCYVYNDGAFAHATDRESKADSVVYLNHGEPLLFGAERERGLRVNGLSLEVVELDTVARDDVLAHDEAADDPAVAWALSRMTPPHLPEPLGVLRAVRRPVFEVQLLDAMLARMDAPPQRTLDQLFRGDETWRVGPAGEAAP